MNVEGYLAISLLFINCYHVTILCVTLRRVRLLLIFHKSLNFHKLNPFVSFHHNTHSNSVHVTYGHGSQKNNFNYSLPLTSNLASATYKESLPFGSFLLPKLQRKFPRGLRLLFPEAMAHQALLCSGHIIELNS